MRWLRARWVLKSWTFCRNGLLQWDEVIRKVVAGTWGARVLIFLAA